MKWLPLVLALANIVTSLDMLEAGVGDPQIRTDHPWYPGELACSTFERLFATQAELFERVTGEPVETDEQRALAAWLWRNTHYWHGEEGSQNLWGKGFAAGGDLRTREYWTGLFAHGFGLCGTTHSQWTVELQELLGHCRARGVGVDGHNALEVFLTGGPYGHGRWALLDHDLSCVIYDESGKALCSIRELSQQHKTLTDRDFKPSRQKGWLISGLHPGDAAAYRKFEVAEYLPGYAGPPPMVHLRRGERLRRYLQPGLEDGKTFVYWGRNYRTGGMPGPERSLTWVNQPERMFGSTSGATYKPGHARFANAVFTYEPNFDDGTYRAGVITEDQESVTFEFNSPYIIAATPPGDGPWDIYQPGCRNGLVIEAKNLAGVSVSGDGGANWTAPRKVDGQVDLTDHVKGSRHYQLRLQGTGRDLARSGVKITTVCQANGSIIPRLVDGTTLISFAATGQAVHSVGPSVADAQHHVIDGGIEKSNVTVEIKSPRKSPIRSLYAAAHTASGNPPSPDVRYTIDYRFANHSPWQPLVRDWSIQLLGDQPKDFWSQSFCYGEKQFDAPLGGAVQVRFSNTGKRPVLRGEAHLVYEVKDPDATKVSFCWDDDAGTHCDSVTFAANHQLQSAELRTGRNVVTKWVEVEPVPR